MAKKAGNDPEERQLFHGTKSETVDAICQQGFDWRMCGKHGTSYGKGSYFASKANYSHRFTASQLRGKKQMFLAPIQWPIAKVAFIELGVYAACIMSKR